MIDSIDNHFHAPESAATPEANAMLHGGLPARGAICEGNHLTPALSPKGGEGETADGDTSPQPSPQSGEGETADGDTSPRPSPQSGEGAEKSLVTSAATTLDRVLTPRDFPPGTRMEDIEEAQARALLCAQYLDLCKTMSGNQAARRLGKAPSWFAGENGMVAKYVEGGIQALLPQRRKCGADESEDAKLVSAGDIARIKAILLRNNRAKNKGSRNAAIQHYCRLPDCPPALKEMVLRRYRAGRLLLPPSVLKKIWVPDSTTCQYRNPTNASLDYLSAPGSAMWYTDPADGERKFIKPGMVIEADDSTINFVCVVPWEMGGCPCSDKYGVKAARFQWLVSEDVGCRFVPAWTYVCRPKSSYRAEDTVTLMNAVYRHYGEPDWWRLERNIWESRLVKRRVEVAGSKLWTVYSPHQKPFIEGLFNKCWTILSLEDGQVGRYRGEMEKENDLLVAAQQGRIDPRGTFPLLSRVVAAFGEALEVHHNSIIRSKNYGEWVPAERWSQRQMRKPEVDLEWLAAPMVKQWRVRGNVVGGQVRLFDGYSAPFEFSADWLPRYHGALVNCHFDPTLPRCSAVVTLAEKFKDQAKDELLGTVHLVNECASYARLVMEWGNDDRTLGRKIKAQAQSAMRREVRTIGQDGKVVSATSEMRDGLGNSAKIETGTRPVISNQSEAETSKEPQARAATPEEFPAPARRRSRDLFADAEHTT